MSDILKKYNVLGQEGNHEYSIYVNTDDKGPVTYTLLASNDSCWSTESKNKILLVMTNTGNGFKFNMNLNKLEYNQGLYVRLLLNFEAYLDKSVSKYKIVEETHLITI